MEDYRVGPCYDPLAKYERIREKEEERLKEEEKKREERLAPYKNVENHIYMHLMEAGDAGAIKELTIALAVIKKIQREEEK